MTPFGPRGPGISSQRHVFGAAFYTHVEAIVGPNVNLPIVQSSPPPPLPSPPPFCEEVPTTQQDGASATTSSNSDHRGDPIYMRNLRRITLPVINHTRSINSYHPNDPRRKLQLERERAEFRNRWIMENNEILPSISDGRNSESRRSLGGQNNDGSGNIIDLEETRSIVEIDSMGNEITRDSGGFEKERRTRAELVPNIDARILKCCVEDFRSHVKKDVEKCEESSPEEPIPENTAEIGSQKLPAQITTIEASKESDCAESTPCEKPDIPSASLTMIPELLAENVGNSIPTFIAKKPRTAITLNLNSHGPTKRPRIVEDVICIEGTIFDKSSILNISERFTDPPPIKKSKRDEATIERNKKEEDEEEEEELVSIMANAAEGKNENTNIEATKKCRLRKKFRQLFGKTVTLSEIEEEDKLINESIPKKRRKESRMSLDSGVCLSEVISERVTASPDEFQERIVDELPAEQEEVNHTKLTAKTVDLDPPVLSMPLLDSGHQAKINNAFLESLPDIGADLTKKQDINIDSFDGKFKILITPFDSNGEDSFAPMSLEFDLISGSHVCTTQIVSETNLTNPKEQKDNYDHLSKLLQLNTNKVCEKTQQDNTISILGENGARITTNIHVSTEMDSKIKSLSADTAATSAKNFEGTSRTKSQVETNREDDSTVKCKDLNEKTILSATETQLDDKIANCENTQQKSISSIMETCLIDRIVDSECSSKKSTHSLPQMCLKEKIVHSKDLHKKIVTSDTKTCFKRKIIDPAVLNEKSTLSATETFTKVIKPQDSNQRTILFRSETCSNDNSSKHTNLSEKTESLAAKECNYEIILNLTKEETVSSSTKKCINDDELNATILKSKPKDSAKTATTSVKDDINGQIPSQSLNSTPQIGTIATKSETPAVETIVMENESTVIIADQEQQTNEKNTPEVQEQLNRVNNKSTNSENNQSSSNSMPKLRLLHHSELGSRWCPTPMTGNESSIGDTNKSAEIKSQIAPTVIQPILQASNSAEYFYPDNQLQYLPYFLENVAPDMIDKTPNSINNSTQNCCNISDERPACPFPGHFVLQKPSTSKKVSFPSTTNLVSTTTTSNTPNYYGNNATESYNTSGKPLVYVSSDYGLPKGTTITKETPSNLSKNFASHTMTSSTSNFYNSTAQNNYNSSGKELDNFSTSFCAPHATTNNQKIPSPAHSNSSSSSMTTNLLVSVPIDYSVVQGTPINEKALSSANTSSSSSTITVNVIEYDNSNSNSKTIQNAHNNPLNHLTNFVQGSTSYQKTTSVGNPNFPSSTITTNTQTQYVYNIPPNQLMNFAQGITSNQKTTSIRNPNVPSNTLTTNTRTTQNVYNIPQNQPSNFAQGTSNPKTTSVGNQNFPSNTITTNTQITQIVHNVPQNQLTNFGQGTTINQKVPLPANANFSYNPQMNRAAYTLDAVFSQVHKYIMVLQNFIKLSCMSVTDDERKQLQNEFLDNKKLLFAELIKYCLILNTRNIDIAIQDFVKRYEQIVEPDQRQFDLMQVLFICRLGPLPIVNADAQRQMSYHCSSTTAVTNSVPRRRITKKNSTTRVAQNKQRCGAAAQPELTIDSAVPQSGTENSRTPPNFASSVPQNGTTPIVTVPEPGTMNSRALPSYVSAFPQAGTGNPRTPPMSVSAVPQPGTGNPRTPPTYVSTVPQPGTTNSRTPPNFASSVPQNETTSIVTVPQPGTMNSRALPSYVSAFPQAGTGNPRTPPTSVSAIPQPGTGNSRTPPTYVSTVPQPGTTNSRTPPNFASSVPQNEATSIVTVPQPGTMNSRKLPTYASAFPQVGTGNPRTPSHLTSSVSQNGTTSIAIVPQPGTMNLPTPLTYVSAVPQHGATNSRTPPSYVSAVPQHGATNSRSPPTYVSAVPQHGATNSRSPPTYVSAVPQPGTTNSRTPPNFAYSVPKNGTTPIVTVPEPGTMNSRALPSYVSAFPQAGTGNPRTPPTSVSAVPQPGTGNPRTPPTYVSTVPQPGTTNSRTPPNFASSVPQNGTTPVVTVPEPGTMNSRALPSYVSAFPQAGTGNPRTPPTYVSAVPHPGPTNSRIPPNFGSSVSQTGTTSIATVRQSGTMNSRTPPTNVSGVPQHGTGNLRTPPTFASAVPQNGPTNSGTPPTIASAAPQNATTSALISGVLQPQFSRPCQPTVVVFASRCQEFSENEASCNYFYSPETLLRVNRQIENYNTLYRRMHYDLHKIYMQYPVYRQSYRQALADNVLRQRELTRQMNMDQNMMNQQQELRRNLITPQQEIPSTVNNYQSQPNPSCGIVSAGILEQIRNLVESFDSRRGIFVQNSTICSNQARIPNSLENLNLRQEIRQSSTNLLPNAKNLMESIIESTLRHYLTTDNNNCQPPVQKNTGETASQNFNNSITNCENIVVPMENNNSELQTRLAAPFQPNTPQEAINNRNALLEMRLSSATNQEGKATLNNEENQNPRTLAQEPVTQEPTTSGTFRETAPINEKNAANRKPNRKNRKDKTCETNDEKTVVEAEQMDNNVEWEVKLSPLKAPNQPRSQKLTVRFKRVNNSANDDSGNQLEMQQQIPAINQEIVRQNYSALACNNSTTGGENLAVNSIVERSDLPQNSTALNQELIKKNSSDLSRNDSSQNDENVAVHLIEDRPESRQNPDARIIETIQTNSSSLPFDNSTVTAKQNDKDLAVILTTEEPKFRQNSGVAIGDKSLSNTSSIRVVDVLEEFDAVSPNKKKKSSSLGAQSLDQNKCLPLVTTIVPLDVVEESSKTVIQESEEEDNDFTLYQSDDETEVSAASKISVITIKDEDDEDEDDFHLMWIEESETAETANDQETSSEEFTLPQSVEMAKKQENEIREITMPQNAVTAEEVNETREITSPTNAVTAREVNEIREMISPEIAEAAKKESEITESTSLENAERVEVNEIIELTSPEKTETAEEELFVEIDEERVDKNSCVIAETSEKIQDEPMEICSILDVKSISKDVFNNIGESGDLEPVIPSEIQAPNESDNLDIKDLLLPNCFRCGKASSVVCEQCFSAFYCSAECHHTHWADTHHLSCKPVSEEAREMLS